MASHGIVPPLGPVAGKGRGAGNLGGGKGAGRGGGKGGGKGVDAGRGAGKGAGKGTGKGAGKSANKGSGKGAGKGTDKMAIITEPQYVIKKRPTTCAELLGAAREMRAAGIDQSEVIPHLHKIAESYGIRMRHDQHDPHMAPVKTTNVEDAPPPAAVEDAPPPAAVEDAPPPAAVEDAPSPAAVEDAPSPAAVEDAPPPAAFEDAPPPAAFEDAPSPAAVEDVPSPAADKNKKAAKNLPVSFIRLPDGTHHLAIGELTRAGPPQTSPQYEATVGRLVLSSDRRGGNSQGRDAPICYECNGLVVDARTWSVLACPPKAYNNRPAANIVNAALTDEMYDIIRVDDGTVVTLYCWDHPTDGPVWSLASSNGYDVSSLLWIGPLTYAAIFHDLTERLYPEFVAATGMGLDTHADGTTRLTFTNLDRNYCYTVGFRHHNFHPLKADPERMWQIQSADVSGDMPVVVFSGNGRGLPGIPDQVVYPSAEIACAGAPPSIEALRAAGSNALPRAAAYIAQLAAGTPRVEKTPVTASELNYGYILRSRDPARTRENSDILIETPLLARIRKIVYERAPRSVRDSLTATDRLEYNALRAFLTSTERGDFLALYPDWASRFCAYEEFINNIVHLVVHTSRQRAMAPASREPSLKSPTGQVARALLDHICRFEQLSPFHKDTESIVHDYVVSPEYAFLYLRAMRGVRAE
jgi:hypothetical protein